MQNIMLFYLTKSHRQFNYSAHLGKLFSSDTKNSYMTITPTIDSNHLSKTYHTIPSVRIALLRYIII